MSNIIAEYSKIDINSVLEFCLNKENILFDMDGTLVHTEPLHFEVVQSLYKGEKIITNSQLSGMTDDDVFKYLRMGQWYELSTYLEKKNELLSALIKTKLDIIISKDIYILLDQLKKAGKKLALVTASERAITKTIVDGLKLKEYFDIIITRQDVKKTKPSPAPYQLALKMLDINKEETLIFEDSPTGIKSAQAADIDIIKVSWYQ